MLLNNKIPDSPAEDLALQGFRRFGLESKRNYQVEFFYIDFAFPDKKVGVEINSYKYHTDTEKDIRRWNFLINRGWKMYKFMAKQVFQNRNLPAAYVYMKQFGKDQDLLKVAQAEIYKFLQPIMTDQQRQSELNKILND